MNTGVTQERIAQSNLAIEVNESLGAPALAPQWHFFKMWLGIYSGNEMLATFFLAGLRSAASRLRLSRSL